MKLLIVDDEPLIRKRLEQLITSSPLGIHAVESTSDPVRAMELLKAASPQILITDIRMPRISGLDLARYVYENQLETLVIFITGYSDFEYAKSGIAYQVFDYLLKPIDEEQAIKAIRKAIHTLQEKQKHDEIHSLFQNYFSTHFTTARRQFIEKLLFHPLTQTKEQLLSVQKQFQMDAASFCLCALRFTCSSGFGEDFYYSHMIEQHLTRSDPDFLTYPFGDTIYILWMSAKEAPSAADMYERLREIRANLEQSYPIQVLIGVSDAADDLSRIPFLRKQVTRCLENAGIRKTSPITFFSDLPDTLVHEDYFDIIQSITSLIRLMRLREKEPVQKEYEKITEQFQGRSESYVTEAIDLITSNILLFIQDLSIPPTETAKIENNILTPLRRQTEIRLKLQYLQYWIDFIVDWVNDAQAAEQNHLIQSIYDYIDANYGESIGLASLSEHVSRNPSYLSRFIKQNTNKNFSQILTERRMEEAKNLLRNTNLKVPQIAEKTGYPNVRYFTRVFHSQFSMSPTDYRKITTAFFKER